MPNTTSKAQFARDCNVSKPAISKAVKTGNIILTAEGQVNLDHRVTKEYISVQSAKKKDAKKPPPKKKATAKKPPAKKATTKKATTPKTETLSDEESEDKEGQQEFTFTCLDDVTSANIQFVTKERVDVFKGIESAKKTKQEREEKRGILVNRSFVKTIFSKLYSVHVNQFKTMESRMTADICGLFKFSDSCDEAVELRKMFNDDTSNTLKNIKRLFDDAVEKMEEE